MRKDEHGPSAKPSENQNIVLISYWYLLFRNPTSSEEAGSERNLSNKHDSLVVKEHCQHPGEICIQFIQTVFNIFIVLFVTVCTTSDL